jgi:hypothetical protein
MYFREIVGPLCVRQDYDFSFVSRYREVTE